MHKQWQLLAKELTANEGPLFTKGSAQELPLTPSLSNSSVATVFTINYFYQKQLRKD